MNVTTDPELLQRVKDWREDDGWREFYGRYAPAIQSHARRSGLSAEEAQDVVQMTMLKVATHIPKFEYDRTVCKFRTWLNLIVNQRIMAVWQERRRSQLPEQVRAELAARLDRNTEERAQAQSELEHRMLEVCMARVRDSVKPRHWQIFEANVIGRLKAGEVAQRFHTSSPNVWIISFRLVRRLRAEWKTLFDKPFAGEPDGDSG